MNRQYKRLTMEKRLQIEALLRAKVSPVEISRIIGCHHSTVYREMRRGRYTHLNGDYTTETRYSATKGEQWAKFNRTTQGAQPKIGNDHDFANTLDYLIGKKRLSPAAALGQIKRKGLRFRTSVCVATVYNYIRKGVIGVDERALWRGFRPRRKERPSARAKSLPRGLSIEKRPAEISARHTFGHWELDSVIGKREAGETLLVLTERKTRFELVFRAPDKSAASTVRMINALERRLGRAFPSIFRTVTCDNGSEFAATAAMETSPYTRKRRTTFYYCHPFSSWERGSNENQNAFLRRFLPKGKKIEAFSDAEIASACAFLNTYPRKILDWQTSQDLFESELTKLFPARPEKIFNFFRKTT